MKYSAAHSPYAVPINLIELDILVHRFNRSGEALRSSSIHLEKKIGGFIIKQSNEHIPTKKILVSLTE